MNGNENICFKDSYTCSLFNGRFFNKWLQFISIGELSLTYHDFKHLIAKTLKLYDLDNFFQRAIGYQKLYSPIGVNRVLRDMNNILWNRTGIGIGPV